MAYSIPVYKEGQSVFIEWAGKMKEGKIRYRWGNGDYQINIKGHTNSVSRPPTKIWPAWDIHKEGDKTE